MDPQDFNYERLVAVLLGRKTHLEAVLARVDESGKRDRYGRAPFLVQGAERARVEDELRCMTEALATVGA